MGTKIIVLNLPQSIDASALEDMFTLVGDVRASIIEYDTASGKSTGIGHVEMSTEAQALDVISHFNGQTARGHVLVVREDKPHVPKPRSALKKVARRSASTQIKTRTAVSSLKIRT
jgi:RNA recognition motif-containing protein